MRELVELAGGCGAPPAEEQPALLSEIGAHMQRLHEWQRALLELHCKAAAGTAHGGGRPH